ncbi:MAG: orotidine-5'-phosphate decarboxylase [Pseudobdellovibrio sp.]|nr:orotidine-5'-phosphate decarboxylase [Pseudobdellovibrio sp.]
MNSNLIKNPIMLALDVDTKEQAKKILDQVGSDVGAIKIGPRLGYQYGADFIKECAAIAPVFIDNKYFDIPSTMVSAVKTSFQAGATFVTVHALSGKEALTELAKLEKELNQIRPFKILAVTILTSWDQQSMPKSLQPWQVSEHVVSLANLVQESGLSGLVCSAHELEVLKNHNLYKVTPGIRPAEASTDDQKRVMNPQQALRAGASALVIGRPILQAPNPKQAVLDILKTI